MTELHEVGRKISRATAEALRQALEAIRGILDEADGESQEARESRRALPLSEARNVAEWMEAELHRHFTCRADDMFGEGRLTREERIALSSAIGSALDAFRATLLDAAPNLYQRDIWQAPDGSYAESAIIGAIVPLREVAAIGADGTFDACLITPGWGTSGYYSAEVLRRDGPQVFEAGTQMFFDHPTEQEEAERPEGSVRNLAARLAGPAAWREAGWNGPGLYAPARALETERETINALAPVAGLSIRASGIGRPGEAEGRKGLVIERLTAARSVDLVTVPGRGGAIRVLAESARQARRQQETSTMSEPTQEFNEAAIRGELRQLREALASLQQQNATQARELVIRDGAALIREALDSREELPGIARTRIAGAVRPVLTAEAVLDRQATLAAVESAIEAEIAYLNQVAGPGRIRGLGESAPRQEDPAQLAADLERAFAGLGLSEAGAKIAAGGR